MRAKAREIVEKVSSGGERGNRGDDISDESRKAWKKIISLVTDFLRFERAEKSFSERETLINDDN